VILPLFNAAPYVEAAIASVLEQTILTQGVLELSLFDDGSTDGGLAIVRALLADCHSTHPNLRVVVGENPAARAYRLHTAGERERESVVSMPVCGPPSPLPSPPPFGIGYACNMAIRQATGSFLCRLDADDIMAPTRVSSQLRALLTLPPPHTITGCLLGSGFSRLPTDATPRYTQWLNSMTQQELMTQRFREVTLLHPTWFFHRSVWERVGGYCEDPSQPEDLLFFHTHIQGGGSLHRVDRALLQYRYHEGQRSWKVGRKTLGRVKARAFEVQVLGVTEGRRSDSSSNSNSNSNSNYDSNSIGDSDCSAGGAMTATAPALWSTFSIWGAGRDGKDFYKALSTSAKHKVTCFWDVDPKKIGTDYYDVVTRRNIPVRAREELVPPVVVCVALARDNGMEAALLASGLREGLDYFCLV
jgi:ribonuclease P protein subunit RPP14